MKLYSKKGFVLTNLLIFLAIIITPFFLLAVLFFEYEEVKSLIYNKKIDNNFILEIKDKDVDLLFVGDVMLSREIGKIMEEEKDWVYPFKLIEKELASADIIFGNLEGPISSRGVKAGSIYSFRADPRAVEGLKKSGFNILSLSNNHIWDYGREAFLDTLDILNKNEIYYIGAGKDFKDAHNARIIEINDIKIGFLAYTNLIPKSLGENTPGPTVSYIEKEQIQNDIEKTKLETDYIVTSFHWGDEYNLKHNNFQEELAHFVIDLGADIIIGHHPHVVQEVERYNDKIIAYSLGNFIFDQNFGKTKNGLILKININNKGNLSYKEIPILFNKKFQPLIKK